VTDPVPVARYLYLGKVVLGYPEHEVWHMTLKKLNLLLIEHLKATGAYQPPGTVEDLMP
jgi:hypothetical protein